MLQYVSLYLHSKLKSHTQWSLTSLTEMSIDIQDWLRRATAIWSGGYGWTDADASLVGRSLTEWSWVRQTISDCLIGSDSFGLIKCNAYISTSAALVDVYKCFCWLYSPLHASQQHRTFLSLSLRWPFPSSVAAADMAFDRNKRYALQADSKQSNQDQPNDATDLVTMYLQPMDSTKILANIQI